MVPYRSDPKCAEEPEHKQTGIRNAVDCVVDSIHRSTGRKNAPITRWDCRGRRMPLGRWRRQRRPPGVGGGYRRHCGRRGLRSRRGLRGRCGCLGRPDLHPRRGYHRVEVGAWAPPAAAGGGWVSPWGIVLGRALPKGGCPEVDEGMVVSREVLPEVRETREFPAGLGVAARSLEEPTLGMCLKAFSKTRSATSPVTNSQGLYARFDEAS
jgi:hypothetical protein